MKTPCKHWTSNCASFGNFTFFC